MLKMIYTCGKCNKKFERGRYDKSPLREDKLSFGIDGVYHEIQTEICKECHKIFNLRCKTFLEEMEREFKLYDE